MPTKRPALGTQTFLLLPLAVVSVHVVLFFVMVLFVICVRVSWSHAKRVRSPVHPGIKSMRQYIRFLTLLLPVCVVNRADHLLDRIFSY